MSYSFPIIDFCNPGLHYETPCVIISIIIIIIIIINIRQRCKYFYILWVETDRAYGSSRVPANNTTCQPVCAAFFRVSDEFCEHCESIWLCQCSSFHCIPTFITASTAVHLFVTEIAVLHCRPAWSLKVSRLEAIWWLQTSVALWTRSELFWDFTQRRMAIPHWRFGPTRQYHLQGFDSLIGRLDRWIWDRQVVPNRR